jgi:hypothetical protein
MTAPQTFVMGLTIDINYRKKLLRLEFETKGSAAFLTDVENARTIALGILSACEELETYASRRRQ